ncbi:MAG TPA: DUF4870 domain-containing protein [Bacteroidales bacterium]|nr:DUF4870 domain-containing protein [Bacteroidales bacterium]
MANFAYVPAEHETEKASNSYVMSIIAVIAGMPLPVINLIATLIFYLGNRKGSYFTRWHCTQALLSQSSLLIINTAAVVWSFMILFHKKEISDSYIAFLITMILFNIAEFIATVHAAVKTRKGHHVEWYFYGTLTDLICREK